MMDDKADLVFYGNPHSRARIAHWMLEEVGEPYETNWLDYGEQMKSPEYLAVNPMGKVPAIVHGGQVVTEAAAICAYLAMAFPEKGLMPPPGDPSLADFCRWMFFAAGPLEAVVTVRAMKWTASGEQSRMLGFGSAEAAMNALEGHLSGREFACGGGFTALDVYLCSQLVWGMQFDLIEARPAFKAYAEPLTDRPAFERSAALCEARARETGA